MKQKTQGYQSCSNMVQIGKPNIAGPDLPSIILRNKVPELYRNGCTQRIRACEGNLLDGDLSVSKGVEKIRNENGDGFDEGEGIDLAPINKVDNVVNSQENIQPADDLLSNWHLLKSVRRKRRRAMRNRKADYPSPGSSPDHFLNIDKTSNTGSLTAHSSPASDCGPDCAPGEDPSQMGHSLLIEKAEPDMKLGFTEMYGNEPQYAKLSGVLSSTVVEELVMAKIDSPRQESRSLESLEVPVDSLDFENVSSQSLNSLTKIAEVYGEVPSQTSKDRVIKYTFQRKRKREQFSVSEENAPIEKSSSKEINEEKLNGHVEPKMSNSATESSRDSRRTAQVARQLISLSEKKWWQ
ncbi:putative pentatricopeptide repeat-containing protein, chloroplastic-like [Capsicum annuum]|nr:putative pentatricopeptide repeat-containing protein, chloroplastic-like [Capsicum annuum]